MNEVSLKPVIEELENLFSKFNARFFDGGLEKPVITVSPDHTRGAYGWCTAWKAWKAGEDEGHYEINLCAEYLNRPFEETCGTLIHEMVHLQNLQDGVQDTSRSGTYHNKKFKETAEAHGHPVVDTYTGGGEATPIDHNHPIQGRKKFKVHNALVVGDWVLLARMQKGKKFVVLDRIKANPALKGEWL